MKTVEQSAERKSRSPEAVAVHFPDTSRDLDQDKEWCEVELEGERRRIRFHDYGDMYAIPGLYERVFYDKLECQSPTVVRSLLETVLRRDGTDPAELRALDVGAGNGIVGEQLAELGARSLVGLDIIEEAATSAERDRPGLYEDYFVVDLTDLPADVRRRLEDFHFNCLTVVAALGFGDIPPRAFWEACNLVSTPGWVAFNIKEDFLAVRDPTGFNRLVGRMLDEGVLDLRAQRRYRHRLSVTGEPLHYVAMVAVKRADAPEEWVAELE